MARPPSEHRLPAPEWGAGVTRRAIRLRGTPGAVEVALEDMRHAMICTLRHDGQAVTALDADFRRYTLQTCPQASVPLQTIVGMSLDTSTPAFFAGGRARQNCTHMLDLAWLALRHAGRGTMEWLYEIEIPDAATGPTRGLLRRNGAIVQDWLVEEDLFLSPPAIAGQSIAGGFTRWLTTASGFSDLAIEECLILHKGFFMTGARRVTMPEGPLPEAYRQWVTGRCFGYAPERIDSALGMTGMERDFTHDPDKLLRFE